ncbi:uncharacterized protein M6B38_121290 [Iris pallida]|uniref:Sacsin/Nov domain-containing protein n=1 Tax=Iris pallida TaxID=29817 RepID=A0AAX6H9R3_IRIPA|nr:uncharacterized protein M6B38_121290 [Iris pallida]
MDHAREHIDRMRRERYSIGKEEKNPMAEDIHQAVTYLSEELYAKDVHFLMEIIQNAEDNEYPSGVAPSLEFVITSKDITATGANSTLIIFNNERGFSSANIDSICRVGKSTKKGNRHRGYIGEKGIGFKSVFLICSQPYIFSNGYQIRFNEEPCPECGVGYIVPEWVEKDPIVADIKRVYGSSETLPATTIILPLKAQKVQAVKEQLSILHPEILLFLSKIKRLSVREDNEDPKLNTVKQVSISSETDVQMRKNMDAESYTLHLSAHENGEGEEEECSYYMWKQKFAVKSGSREKKRAEVDEWVITLAFPWGRRLNRGLRKPGVYAFLPTEMVTNFPFIIQADFLLASSREAILVDSPWNKGILECVPSAFVNAFVALVKSTEGAPSFSLPPMFQFLPIQRSSIPLLDSVRVSIKEKVAAEHIIPCESQSNQKVFSKPNEVRRLLPTFWDILIKAQKIGVDLKNLSSHGPFILSSSFDKGEYDEILGFLDVGFVDMGWYGKCIESSNLAREATEEIYLELLCFIGDNCTNFVGTSIQNIPLIRYVDTSGGLSFWSIYRATQFSERVCIASEEKYSSWLISWNSEFGSSTKRFFLPRSTQTALRVHTRRGVIMDWLQKYVYVETLDVYKYAKLILNLLGNDRRFVIAYTHFLYHSLSKNHLAEWAVNELCSSMPLVDNYGSVTAQRKEVLVPAKGSKWVELMGSNPWRGENYVELGATYISAGSYAGNYTSEDQLLAFLRSHTGASDVPDICPPNARFPTVSSPLTKENAFLLLQWLRNLRYRGLHIPQRFLNCIKEGSWLKTSVGYKPPSESFLSSSDWGSLLQMASVLVDIPMINAGFYDHKISSYKEELKMIGVRFEFGEASTYIGDRLMSMAESSTLTRVHVISLLKLIRFLREKRLSPSHLIDSVKDERWLKTSHGYRSPGGSVLFSSEWAVASYVSNLPFVETGFYGEEILQFKTELELLGVIVSFRSNYQLLVDHFKLSNITADSTILILDCIRYVRSSEGFVRKLRELRWMKTHLGYKKPGECFLVDSEWECLLEVVDDVPLIDHAFYGGRMGSYKEELKTAGVLVKFEDASKAIAHRFKQLISSSSLTKKNVLSLLLCRRKLKDQGFPVDLVNCIRSEKWLKTRTGLRTSTDAILFDPEWESVSPIAALPLIDDSDASYGKEIYGYKNELKSFGVVTEFKKGASFVLSCLNIPKDPSVVTPSNVLSLLKCIRYLKEKKADIFPKEFFKSINKKWLKTAMGYQSPGECILFESKGDTPLQRDDGPFLDEAFYGSEIVLYRDELKEMGVVVDIGSGCSLVANHLNCHSKLDVISRIYMYLSKSSWEPNDDEPRDWIWVPNGSNGGKWASSGSCVLHDKDNLFGSRLHVLDKHYESNLHGFFSTALKVRCGPTVEDYCSLWNEWEIALRQPTLAECSAFWVFIAKHWSGSTEQLLKGRIKKLPVFTENGVSLSNKQDVFIPDDLLLKDLFDEVAPNPLFIWYPQTKLASTSRSKMNTIFRSLGVQSISEATRKDEAFECTEFRKINPGDTVIKTGLLRLVLGFLADPSLDIPADDRHQIVGYLFNTAVFETDDPIAANYSLTLSSGKTLVAKASRIFRWERENLKLYVHKMDRSSGQKGNIEFATYFSEVISEGLLYEKVDRIPALAELVKLGCLVDFDEMAVKFLLQRKNLQLFSEDEELLSSATIKSSLSEAQQGVGYDDEEAVI